MADGWNDPSDEECQRIARKASINYSDWVRLTGVMACSDFPLFWIAQDEGIRPKKWDKDFVNDAPIDLHIEMADDNARDQMFAWGQTPAELVAFVEADTKGLLWLPDAFVRAVEAAGQLDDEAADDPVERSVEDTGEAEASDDPVERSVEDTGEAEAADDPVERSVEDTGEAEAAEIRLRNQDIDAESARQSLSDVDKEVAALFDLVKVPTLEKMFPDDKKWKKYAERAKRNGLIEARGGRGVFNPYTAARWWLETQAPAGWDWARCIRVLANNLPTRSQDSKHLLTGDFD